MHGRQRADWEKVLVRQPRTPWWEAMQPAVQFRRDVEPMRPLGAAQAASMSLLDFVQSGVDEDLERLRRGWHKPPTPPSSDEKEQGIIAQAARRGGRLVDRPRWHGPLDTEDAAVQRAAARPLQAKRVCGGALDYRAKQRLELLSNLRLLASSGAAAPQHAALVPPRVAGSCHEVPQTAAERDARRSLPPSSAGCEHTSWESWERRWAEELRAFTTAAHEQRQLALAVSADSPLPPLYPLRPRQHPHGMGRPPPSRERRDFPHAMPPADDGSDSDDDDGSAWQQQRQHQRQRQRQHQRQQQRQHQRQQHTQNLPRPQLPPSQRLLKTFASWAEYNAAFEAFEARLPSLEAVSLSDVPFPPSSDPAGFGTVGAAATERKRLLRKALLRWHPDKWASVLPHIREADRSAMADQLSTVTQAIVRQKNTLE